MIQNKKELKKYIKNEKYLYFKSKKEYLLMCFVNDPILNNWKFLKYLRKTEFYYNKKKTIINRLMYIYYRRKKNNLGLKLGLEMWENSFDEGLMIYHSGNIVVNGNARIGKNCKLHGDNCIGNNGKDERCPHIGDNVDIGVGAKIIGDIYIANDIKIGAGAIVTKSFYEEGITICGVPAKMVKKV